MSFAVAANGAVASISQPNQFQTTWTGGTFTSVPTMLGSASVVPLALQATTNTVSMLTGAVSGDTYPSLFLGGSGYNLGFADGTLSAPTATLRGGASGLYSSVNFTAANGLSVNGTLSGASLTASSLNITGSTVTLANGSNFSASQLSNGTFIPTGDSAWQIGFRQSGDAFLTAHPTGASSSHCINLYGLSGGSPVWCGSANSDHSFTLANRLNFLVGSLARVTFFGGTGSSTVSHGLGTTPTYAMQMCTSTSSNTSSNFNNMGSSTVSMTMGSSLSWKGVAWLM